MNYDSLHWLNQEQCIDNAKFNLNKTPKKLGNTLLHLKSIYAISVLSQKESDKKKLPQEIKKILDESDKSTKYFNKHMSFYSEIYNKIAQTNFSESILKLLMPGTFYISIPFVLTAPYISRDDEVCYPTENPVHKDKAFKIPMISSSSWKGAFRSTCIHYLAQWVSLCLENAQNNQMSPDNLAENFAQKRIQVARIFGDEKGEEMAGLGADGKEKGHNKEQAAFLDNLLLTQVEKYRDTKNIARDKYREMMLDAFDGKANAPIPNHSGRLRLYPTFFDNLGLAMINPHDRKTRTNRDPVTMECVPRGTSGILSMFYLPWPAKIGKENLVKESLQDLNLVANAAYDVLCTTGFGAKTSSIGARAQNQLPPGKKAEILFFTGADRAGNAISPKKLEGDKLENVLSSILEYGEKLQEGLTAPPNRREDKAL